MATRPTKTVVGFLFALLFLLAFTGIVGWNRIAAVVADASARLLILGGIISFGGVVGLGLGWLIVVRDVVPYDLLDGLRVYFAAMFANAVTPLGQFGGEPFIAYVVSRDARVPYEESLGAATAADLANGVQFFSLSFLGILIFLIYFPLDPVVTTILRVAIGLLVGM
ncbi:MAG: flippase-like domain-containing protein, partial [Candidatus Nanohaloarchaea archaeon]